MIDYCAFCFSKENTICKSHAIPNFYFRKTKTNGSSIIYRTDNSKNALLNESGDARLLCTNCESDFNINYDTPLIQTVDKILTTGKITPSSTEILAKSLFSILWRASKSDATMYKNFNLNSNSENTLLELMRGSNKDFKDSLSLRVRSIFIINASEDPAMVITSPKLITMPASKNNNIFQVTGVFVCFGGLYFELFIPKPPLKYRLTQDFLSFRTSTITLKKISFLHTADGYEMVAHMKDKDNRGHATFALQKLNFT